MASKLEKKQEYKFVTSSSSMSYQWLFILLIMQNIYFKFKNITRRPISRVWASARTAGHWTMEWTRSLDTSRTTSTMDTDRYGRRGTVAFIYRFGFWIMK